MQNKRQGALRFVAIQKKSFIALTPVVSFLKKPDLSLSLCQQVIWEF
jgi:hypothetical protein